jgi:hypothetical protein
MARSIWSLRMNLVASIVLPGNVPLDVGRTDIEFDELDELGQVVDRLFDPIIKGASRLLIITAARRTLSSSWKCSVMTAMSAGTASGAHR